MKGSIYVSLGRLNAEECLAAVKKYKDCELRLDLLDLSDEELSKVFSESPNIIASYRNGTNRLDVCVDLLKKAADLGAAYIDVDLAWPDETVKEMISYIKRKKRGVLISYHNEELTPPTSELKSIIEKAKSFEPDVIKIACACNSMDDSLRLMELIETKTKMIVIGMGTVGRPTRPLALKLGAFATFASMDGHTGTGPGQLSISEIKTILEEWDRE